MQTLLLNNAFVFWTAVTLISTVPCVAFFWAKVRKAEIEADLKRDLLERGMSAAEIRVVVEATARKRGAQP